MPFTDEYETLLDTYLANNKAKRDKSMKEKKSKSMHSYSLEDYGLSKALIQEEFKDYINKYNLSEKK